MTAVAASPPPGGAGRGAGAGAGGGVGGGTVAGLRKQAPILKALAAVPVAKYLASVDQLLRQGMLYRAAGDHDNLFLMNLRALKCVPRRRHGDAVASAPSASSVDERPPPPPFPVPRPCRRSAADRRANPA